jgi:23S rRNA (guanine745-N1)-methyltransferase
VWIDVVRCPICASSLTIETRTVRCESKHAFDFAREGYLHLLPSGHGRAGVDGDTRPMLEARRRFLATGSYAPLAALLLARFPLGIDHPVILDVGCGEGTYSKASQDETKSTNVVGVDVSREAVRMAAREHKRAHFVVADVKQGLPIKDEAVDVVVDVFAPRNPLEFARVLKPGGTLLVAIPTPEHLQELRARHGGIGIEPDKRTHVIEQMQGSFDVDDEALWRSGLALAASSVRDLLHMTPSHHHVDDDADVDVAALNVTASVQVLRFLKKGGRGSRR